MSRAMIWGGLVGVMAGSASGQGWLDNFNDGSAEDGSPVVWVSSPAFGSDFDVVDGDLLISIPSDGGAISSPRVESYFAAGASVRARM